MKDVLNLVSCPVSSLLLSPPPLLFWVGVGVGTVMGFFFCRQQILQKKLINMQYGME
jgi:hypothetical protein